MAIQYIYPSAIVDLNPNSTNWFNQAGQPVSSVQLKDIDEGVSTGDGNWIQPSGSHLTVQLWMQVSGLMVNPHRISLNTRLRFTVPVPDDVIMDSRLLDRNFVIIGNTVSDEHEVTNSFANYTVSRNFSGGALNDTHDISLLNWIVNYTSFGNEPDDIQFDAIELELSGTTGIPRTSGLTLYIGGPIPVDSGFPLYIAGPFPDNSGITLFIDTPDEANTGIPLYISGVGFATQSMDLYMCNQLLATSGVDLFLKGSSPESNQFPLFIKGNEASSDFPLFIYGHETFPPPTERLTLFMKTHDWIPSSGTLPLFLNCSISASGVSGNFSTFPLFTQGGNTPNDILNLYIHGDPQINDKVDNLALFIKVHGNQDGTITESYSFPLFAKNEYQTVNSGLPLVINVPDSIYHSGSLNLIIWRDESVAQGMSMYIPGPSGVTEGLPLFLEGQPSANSGIPVFIQGISTPTDNIELYIHGA